MTKPMCGRQGQARGLLDEKRQLGVSLQQLHFLFWVFVACSLVALANSAVL